MKNFAIWTAVSIFAFSPVVNAGFEWSPPTQNPVSIPSYAPQAGLSSVNSSMHGIPAAPVVSEQLSMRAPTSILPPHQKIQNLSTTGLVINPYPLRNTGSGATPVALSMNAVEQAMVEEARILNPLKLGAGLQTGTKFVTASLSPISVPNNIRPVSKRLSLGSNLTPMVGGEPAPLSGVAGVPRAPVMAMPIQQYTKAVGFGRDLPLDLALSQIIPSEFSHSYAGIVDSGTTVSWKGGKSWDRTLEEMLNSKNLTASIQGNRVMITPLSNI